MRHIKKKHSAAQNSIKKLLQSSHFSLNQSKSLPFLSGRSTLLWYNTFQLSCWNESLYLFKHLHNAPNPDPTPKNGYSWHLLGSTSSTSAWPRIALHSWGHLRTQERAPRVKGEAAGSEGRAETSEDERVHCCCQPCRSFAAGLAAVLLEEMGCSRRGPVDGSTLPKLERCPCESAGEAQRSWEAAAPASQHSVDVIQRSPGSVIPMAALTSDSGHLQQLCSHSWLPAQGSRNWNQRETVRGKSAVGDSESSPGLSESISCLRWCLASVGRGWGSFHFCLLTASSKGKLSCLCVCCSFSDTCEL